MNFSLRHLSVVAASLCALSLLAAPVSAADDYPSKSIKLIVPWGAGGGMDNMSRILEPLVSKSLGKPLAFVYKPGGSSSVGITEVVGSKPDGYTLTVNNFPLQSTNVNIGIGQYHPEDLTPVCMVAQDPTMLVVLKDSPYKTFEEFVAAAKANPGGIRVGVPDRFGPSHGTGLLLLKEGIPLNLVPYAQGSSKANPALLGKHIDAISATISAIMPINDKVRVLIVASPTRIAQHPDARTTAEVGMPNVTGFCGRFYWVPKGTPEPVINKLAAAFKSAVQSPEVVQRLQDAGMEVSYKDSKESVQMIKDMQPMVDQLSAMFKEAIAEGN